ncbi:MAG TPA: DUF3592 domain-containing protein [Acidimicrobiales bacterium]|nr:DUF3592 domain-containing protein [Acidimicrobiales bacterium]
MRRVVDTLAGGTRGQDAANANPAALDEAGVRDALRRYRRNASWILLAGTVLFVMFAIAATVVEGRAEELERSGIQVEGRVIDYSPGGRYVSGTVEVEFYVGQERRTELVHLDDESPEYEVGQVVTVFVDRDDRSRVSVKGETNQSPWTVWPMIISLVAGVAGMITGGWSLLRARRQRKLLSRQPWRRVKLQYREIPGPRGSVRPLVLLADGGSEHLLTLTGMLRSRLGKTGLRMAREAEVVGEVPSYVVLRAAGSDTVVSARPPATKRARRRWLEQFRGGAK